MGIPLFDRAAYGLIGKPALQVLCLRWLRTPMARRAGIRGLFLGGGELDRDLEIEVLTSRRAGQPFRFPTDDLLRFVLEHAELPDDLRAQEQDWVDLAFATNPDDLRTFEIAWPGED